MLGACSKPPEPFDIREELGIGLDPHSFFGQLASGRSRVFRDEDFAPCYAEEVGRPSIAPSQLALMTLLQHYTCCSDEEAVDKSAFDLRWCAVLGKRAGEPLCAKSTFQGFRDRLMANEGVRVLFVASIKEAKRAGLLKRGAALGVSLDTKPMLGRGAVKDTYNLLATGIVKLVEAMAATAGQRAEEWARANDFGRYFGSSLKGSAGIEWSDAKARQAFLNEVVVDVERLQRLAGERLAGEGLEGGARKRIAEAAMLLEALLLQDVVEMTDAEGQVQAELRKGTAADRIPSATDQDQRHGHKSKSKVFTGHKLAVAVDNESGIIVDAQVLAGNAGDAEGALEQVERVEENTGEKVAETTGDCAYGGGETRQAFADAGRDLAAKVPQEAPNKGRYTKSQFSIDLSRNCVGCPGGKTTTEFQPGKNGGKVFRFGAQCDGCQLRGECTQAAGGRTIQVHPQEAMRAAARAYQETAEGRARLQGRVAVEHALARLGHLGVGQARYVGRTKSLFQVLLAATIANLRRTWNWERQQGGNGEATGANLGLAGWLRLVGGLLRAAIAGWLGADGPRAPKEGSELPPLSHGGGERPPAGTFRPAF